MEAVPQQKPPTISVIVPVYKVEKYLGACVDSILAQTYTDFELILVDDGSPDGCGAVCDAYAARDPRVRVIHQENQGLSGARNAGMDVAAGEYLTFVDSDDLVVPQYLELLLKAAVETGAGISACGLKEFLDAEEAEIMAAEKGEVLSYSVLSGREACLAQYQGASQFTIYACAKLFRKTAIGDKRFPVGKLHEDQAFVPPVSYAAGTVAVLQSALYRNRIRNDSITRERFSLKRYDDIWAIDGCIAFFEAQNEPEIVKAARDKRKRILAVYSIYARRDGVTVPEPYRVGLLPALSYLRKHVQPMKYEYYLEQVSPKLARLFEYELKIRKMCAFEAKDHTGSERD